MEKNNSGLHLFQWWKIDEKELTEQIINYDKYNWWKAVRTQSVTCLLFSVFVTSVFVMAKLASMDAIVDIFVMLVLCTFMFKGHKASFLLAMLYWTFSKIYGVVTNPTSAVMAVIWWAMYMRFFYLAFMVEKNKSVILQKIAVESNKID